jgi:hypothetical protein
MVGIGRTVFQAIGSRNSRFTFSACSGNVIGPRRNLILAKLEGGPLAETGVIAGMSGSPVYIDGRLVGAVSYSLGQFSKEPIAGITPIDEMVRSDRARPAAAPSGHARRAADAALAGKHARLAAARRSPGCDRLPRTRMTCRCSAPVLDASVGTMLRPIATPITIGGFDASVIDPVVTAFREQGFLPMMAGAGGQDTPAKSNEPLRPW